ncbi:MAG: membrane dipeptidase [Acidobacteria bacterium]|nr:membrane dipeptidase [Acidobacteriota bacterium]
MKKFLLLPTVLLMTITIAHTQPQSDAALLERARALHRQVPLIDGHNDYPWAVRANVARDITRLDISKPQPTIHTDIERLRKGGVGAQFWSVYVPSSLQGQDAVTATLEQIDIVYAMLRKWPETFELALTADDVERIFKAEKIGSLIGMEGGHSIDNSLGALRMFYRLGARYMTLTHSLNTPWADAATDKPAHNGLTAFGEEVVREMNWLGMLVDLSHVSPDTMADAIRVSQAPIIFSHSSARAVADVPRNVPDEILRMMPNNGGVVMVTFVPQFLSTKVIEHGRLRTAEQSRLREQHKGDEAAVTTALTAWDEANPTPRATIADTADHIDHVRKVAGIDHIGIGGDYDGITTVPEGLEDVSTYPALTAELLRRGYSDDDVKKILGLNVLRVMRQAEKVSQKLRAARGPSTMLFEKHGRRRQAIGTVFRIVALGDSTTAGTPGWRSPIEAPPHGEGDVTSQYAYWLMQARPEWDVLNRGVNRETSAQIRARFDRDVLPASPQAVVILAGVNDIYAGQPAGDVIGQLREMYDRARAHGIRVVAGSIVPYNTATPDQNAGMREVNDWIRSAAAADPNTDFVDTRAAVAAADNPDMLFASPDELHPSVEGYKRMADALLPVLARVEGRGKR